MKLPRYLFVMAGVLVTTHANAQVYKCTFVDDAKRQSKVVYTDSPCHQAQKQTLTAIQTKSPPLSIQALQTAQLAQANVVDSAVARAVLNQNFKLAKSLATTKEHWRLIAIAEGGATPQPIIVASNQPVFSPEDECAQSKDNFESVSRTSWRDKDLVAAKKSVMYVSCGLPEPVINRPIFVGQTYGGLNYGSLNYGSLNYGGLNTGGLNTGGLNTGGWIHHNHEPYQVRPYSGVGHHAYSQAHRAHYGRSQTWGGASLSYKSKHFGINVNNANVR